jgi:hypothetical protein
MLSLSMKRLKAGMKFEIEFRIDDQAFFFLIGDIALDQWMWKHAPFQTMEARQLDCPRRRSEAQSAGRSKDALNCFGRRRSSHVNARVSCLHSP